MPVGVGLYSAGVGTATGPGGRVGAYIGRLSAGGGGGAGGKAVVSMPLA
jgi:hypothetical protein